LILCSDPLQGWESSQVPPKSGTASFMLCGPTWTCARDTARQIKQISEHPAVRVFHVLEGRRAKPLLPVCLTVGRLIACHKGRCSVLCDAIHGSAVHTYTSAFSSEPYKLQSTRLLMEWEICLYFFLADRHALPRLPGQTATLPA